MQPSRSSLTSALLLRPLFGRNERSEGNGGTIRRKSGRRLRHGGMTAVGCTGVSIKNTHIAATQHKDCTSSSPPHPPNFNVEEGRARGFCKNGCFQWQRGRPRRQGATLKFGGAGGVSHHGDLVAILGYGCFLRKHRNRLYKFFPSHVCSQCKRMRKFVAHVLFHSSPAAPRSTRHVSISTLPAHAAHPHLQGLEG